MALFQKIGMDFLLPFADCKPELAIPGQWSCPGPKSLGNLTAMNHLRRAKRAGGIGFGDPKTMEVHKEIMHFGRLGQAWPPAAPGR